MYISCTAYTNFATIHVTSLPSVALVLRECCKLYRLEHSHKTREAPQALRSQAKRYLISYQIFFLLLS